MVLSHMQFCQNKIFLQHSTPLIKSYNCGHTVKRNCADISVNIWCGKDDVRAQERVNTVGCPSTRPATV
ncbi:hypothetical protein OE88DRAFT_1650644, partial [Heliocybe sulcata]